MSGGKVVAWLDEIGGSWETEGQASRFSDGPPRALVLQSDLAAAIARAEAAERDAARYRWLRALDGRCDGAACVNFNIGFDWIEQHGDELDTAIDAAIAAQQAEDRAP